MAKINNLAIPAGGGGGSGPPVGPPMISCSCALVGIAWHETLDFKRWKPCHMSRNFQTKQLIIHNLESIGEFI